MAHDQANGTVIVTGAARGIGREVAHRLAAEGHPLVLIDRLDAELRDVAKELADGVEPWVIDLAGGDADAGLTTLADSLRRAGRPVGAVVSCAGVGGWNFVEDVSPAQWDAILDTNLRGAYLLAHHLVPLLRERRGGAFVVIASDAAEYGFARRTAYCASKHALVGFAAALREELRPYGTRVSVLRMNRVDTGFNGGRPGGRPEVLSPATVADAVAYVLAQPAGVEVRELALASVASPYGPFTAVARG